MSDNTAELRKLLEAARAEATEKVAEWKVNGQFMADWVKRLKRELASAKERISAAVNVQVWTNEDGKRFVFADDLLTALDPLAAPAVVSGTSQAAADDEARAEMCARFPEGHDLIDVATGRIVPCPRCGGAPYGDGAEDDNAVADTGEQAAPIGPAYFNVVAASKGENPWSSTKPADAAPAPTPAAAEPTAHQHWVGDRTYRWCHLTHCAEGKPAGGAA
jgi:hypothetical protein